MRQNMHSSWSGKHVYFWRRGQNKATTSKPKEKSFGKWENLLQYKKNTFWYHFKSTGKHFNAKAFFPFSLAGSQPFQIIFYFTTARSFLHYRQETQSFAKTFHVLVHFGNLKWKIRARLENGYLIKWIEVLKVFNESF